MAGTWPGAVDLAATSRRAIRVCLDVNIFVADFLSGRRGNPAGSSSKIVDLVRDGICALGPVLLPLMDSEDIGVAETAFIGGADFLITSDLDDFESGPRSALKTRRLIAKPNKNPRLLLMEDSVGRVVAAAVPELAVGWLLGQTPVPTEVSELLSRSGSKNHTGADPSSGPGP